MRNHWFRAGSLAGCLIVACGCSGASQDRADESSAPPPAPGSEVHGDPAQAGTLDSTPAAVSAGATSPARTEPAEDEAAYEPIVKRAREALAASGESNAQQARLISVTPAQWNDSSLGCPEPGMSYMQVITSGHVVLFALREGTRAVHVAGDAAIICQRAQVSGTPKRAFNPVRAETLNKAMEAARADLAARLGKPVEEITLSGAAPFVWEDGSFRCGAGEDPRERVQGYKLQLTAANQSFVYHTDFQSTFACPPISDL